MERGLSQETLHRSQNLGKRIGWCEESFSTSWRAGFSDDDTWRALDTMSCLCEQIDSDGAEEIRAILRTAIWLEQGSAAVTEYHQFLRVKEKII